MVYIDSLFLIKNRNALFLNQGRQGEMQRSARLDYK